MIQKEIISFIAERAGINNKELIEKDILLHRLLLTLAEMPGFAENYAFKGGTCLTKCHLGYFRFSEDLDFTYANKSEFAGKTEKQIKKIISERVNELAMSIKELSDNTGLDFKADKGNRRYFEFVGGNKFTTIKLWYKSEESGRENFIKMQINFVEKLLYPIKEYPAESIFREHDKYDKSELTFFLPKGYEWIIKTPKIKCYDLREILVEKVRAVLTRRGMKSRDFLDIFLIHKEGNLNPEEFKNEIIEKTKFVTERYKRYVNNLKSKDFSFLNKFVMGEEEKLLIRKIPEGFEEFLDDFKGFLEELVKELKND